MKFNKRDIKTTIEKLLKVAPLLLWFPVHKVVVGKICIFFPPGSGKTWIKKIKTL